jgi:hypothetical protein
MAGLRQQRPWPQQHHNTFTWLRTVDAEAPVEFHSKGSPVAAPRFVGSGAGAGRVTAMLRRTCISVAWSNLGVCVKEARGLGVTL